MNVNAAMERIEIVDVEYPTETDDRDQQYEMYEKTLEAVKDIDADDDDVGIAVVANWVVEQIESTGKRPSSRAVRTQATQFCRRRGYSVPNDGWMGT